MFSPAIVTSCVPFADRSAVVCFAHAAANTVFEHFVHVPSDVLSSVRMTSPLSQTTQINFDFKAHTPIIFAFGSDHLGFGVSSSNTPGISSALDIVKAPSLGVVSEYSS